MCDTPYMDPVGIQALDGNWVWCVPCKGYTAEKKMKKKSPTKADDDSLAQMKETIYAELHKQDALVREAVELYSLAMQIGPHDRRAAATGVGVMLELLKIANVKRESANFNLRLMVEERQAKQRKREAKHTAAAAAKSSGVQ
jgi:hypothetical protein